MTRLQALSARLRRFYHRAAIRFTNLAWDLATVYVGCSGRSANTEREGSK